MQYACAPVMKARTQSERGDSCEQVERQKRQYQGCIIFDAGLRFSTIGRTLKKSRFRAEIDPEACTGCQDCVERCFFDAIEMKKHPPEKKLKATVDPEKCFGCGLCAVVCDPGAITMKLARVEA